MEQATVTKVKKFYSVMNQALKLAIAHEGMPVDSWDIYEGGWPINKFMNYFRPYLRIMKDCGYDTTKECSTSGMIKNLNGTEGYDYHDFYRLILDDGTTMWLRGNAESEEKVCGPDGETEDVCAGIFYDINGTKKPNTFGKDVFIFYVRPNNVTSNLFDDCNLNDRGWSCANYILKNGNMDYLNKY